MTKLTPLSPVNVRKNPFLILSCALGLMAQMSTSAIAQSIISDGSTSTSVSNPSGANFVIEDGLDLGNNLFHSFSEFSVPTNGSAFFNNAASVVNIFSRVTGGSVSSIDGLIRANSSANLFLLNPNGIILGPNASLNLGGSFVASTADSIQFGNGNEFSAVNPQAPPLVSVNIALGLQFGSNPQPIQVQGTGNNLFVDPFVNGNPIVRAFRPNGLSVNPGQTLALVGGEIFLDGGNLTTRDGRIELGSVGAGEQVSLTPTNSGVELSYGGVSNFQNIILNQAASVEVSGNGSGSIQVQGRQVSLTEGSAILAETAIFPGTGIFPPTLGNGSGGSIEINASESVAVSGISTFQLGPFTLPFSSRISTDVGPGASGTGGDIVIATDGQLAVTNSGRISSGTFGIGNAGTLSVTGRLSDSAQSVNVSDSNQFIFQNPFGPPITLDFLSGLNADVNPNATGMGGAITIFTNGLAITTGGQISSGTLGPGNAGTLTVNAQDIVVNGIAQTASFIPSGLFTPVAPGLTGNGGVLTINTGRLQVSDGAQIFASTFGAGNAGTLNIQATEIELTGTAPGGNPGGLFVNVLPSATGNGGDLTIDTEQLSISGGAQATVNTFSSGDAGTLEIQATEIKLMGTSPGGSSSGLLVNVGQNATGHGGDLIIETGQLQISGGAVAAVTTFGAGDAGTLSVKATEIELRGGSPGPGPSGLFANVAENATGAGGNVVIETDTLQIIDGAQAAAITFGTGNGGTVAVQANEINVVGSGATGPSGLLTTTEQAATGHGGNLTITTEQLQVSNGGQIAVSTATDGNAGTLTVQATQLDLVGAVAQGASGLFGNAIGGTGAGGDLLITSEQITIRDGATISVSNFPSANSDILPGQGVAGDIEIQAGSILLDSGTANPSTITASTASGGGGNILLDVQESFLARHGSQISAEAIGSGEGGIVDLSASTVELSSGAVISTSTLAEGNAGSIAINAGTATFSGAESGAFSEAGTGSSGNGGSILLDANSFTLNNGAQVNTSTLGAGSGGSIAINAGTTTFSGAESGAFSEAGTGSLGNGGNVTLNANSLVLSNGAQVSTSTFGAGNGGSIVIDATNTVLFRDNGSGAFSEAGPTSLGDAGNITIIAGDALEIIDNAQISTSSEGLGQAGNIAVTTGQEILIDGGSIAATSAQTGGGDINLTTNFLSLGSFISTSVFDSNGGGGNIDIVSPEAVILLNGSSILANAVFGPGGNISITTNALFVCPDCVISASSEFGVDGTVEINNSELSRNLVVEALPDTIVDPTTLIAKGCTADEGNVLAVTGRGGLPENPSQPLRGGTLWSDLRPQNGHGTAITQAASSETRVIPTQQTTTNSTLVIAQGWVVGANGNVIFTSPETPVTTQESWQETANCGDWKHGSS